MLDARILKRRREFTLDVRLHVAPGEAVGLFGGSGQGKSTLLSCLAGFEPPDAGEVRVRDRILFPPPVPLHERPVGYLTQNDNLFWHMSVEQNVRFGVGAREKAGARPGPGQDDRDGPQQTTGDWIAELRQALGLESLWHASVRSLSGGQARRVALARMLARRPMVVLLDEPFGGLDSAVMRDLTEALSTWRSRLGFALLAVDHQARWLERLGTRVVAIERGRVVHDGSWEELRRSPPTEQMSRLLD